MPKKCSVKGCKTKNATMRVSRNQEQFKKWLNILNKNVSSISSKDNFRVCDVHFLPEDFQQFGGGIKKKLNDNAVPSINLPNIQENSSISDNNNEHVIINNVSFDINEIPIVLVNENSTQCDIQDIELLKKQVNFYKKKCQDLNCTVKHLKSQKNIDRIVKDRLLARGMTLNMANMYVKGRKFGRNINIQDVVFAATVKGLSPKTYRYIRKRKLIRIPSESSIRRWLSRFKLKPGNF